ncbi:MAG: YfhO family protein [Acholeplasmatales bacterium]|nr:YfhO family protein [Acholeplasmatales bacterium]
MEQALKRNKFKKISLKAYRCFNSIWESKFKAFIFLALVLAIFLAILIIYPLCYNTFFNCNTDDILQYYAYVNGFFEKVKNGTFSLYDTNLLAGTSFFSGVYYIPLDLFLGFAFILSYFMPTEVAYSISNILRPICGALLLYYVLSRKGFNPKTLFIVSFIYFIGGLTETYYIFPVYLGICVYAPLAMLIVDLCIERKGIFYLLIPIYSLIIILFDFYIAYMLFAFLCAYFVIRMHMTEKRFFLISRNFWVRFLEFMGLIFIGLMIASFFLVPSALYITNESLRANQSGSDYLWYFTTGSGKDMKLSIRHYFTQWCNIFSPNNPHNLGLVQAGDYIREHASLYMTSGGIIYLVYFFFIWGKEENRLKFWIVILNLLFCMPLAAMIFTFNEWPYVRWVFIPYMFNLYGMAIAMNKNNFRVGTFNFIKLFPMIFLGLGLSTMIYVLINDPDIFIHYDKNSLYFNPIVIGSIVCISIYLAILLLAFIIQLFKKNPKIVYKLVPLGIFAECIFAAVIAFSSPGSTTYIGNVEEMTTQKNELYNLGYNEKDGYRINLYTSTGKNSLNANILLGNTNHARFFQSFYNPQLNTYYSDIHNEKGTNWNRTSMHGYTMISGPMFNLKYVISGWDCNWTSYPSEYYNYLGEYHNAQYYELKDCPQFIVYDEVFINTNNSYATYFIKDVALLKYGYVKYPKTDIPLEELDPIKNETEYEQYQKYKKIKDSGITIQQASYVFNNIKKDSKIETHSLQTPDEYKWDDLYYYYDLSDSKFDALMNMDALYVCPTNTQISTDYDIHFYFVQPENNWLHPLHYNVGYLSCFDFKPSHLAIKADKDAANKLVYFYGFNYDIYDEFIERQNQYSNRYFELDGSKMTIKFTNNDSSTPKIIKTAYTYSDDWKVENKEYETCDINGGFLGIIIPEGIDNIDITLNYEPVGFITGCKISVIGCIIYLGVTIPIITMLIYKRKKFKKANKAV